MGKKVVECQRGLEEVKKYLEERGYTCYMEGHAQEPTEVLIVNVPDFEWEEINSVNCMKHNEKEKLVINMHAVKKEDLERLIEQSTCKM